jgi:hypothetical protein
MQSMKKRLTEAQFQAAVEGLEIGQPSIDIACGVLVDGRSPGEFVTSPGLTRKAVSQAVGRVWAAAVMADQAGPAAGRRADSRRGVGNYLSTEVLGQVAALESREKALATRAKRLSLVWMVLAGGAGAASLLARFLGPDAWPAGIDVPVRVLKLFSSKAGIISFAANISVVAGVTLFFAGLFGGLIFSFKMKTVTPGRSIGCMFAGASLLPFIGIGSIFMGGGFDPRITSVAGLMLEILPEAVTVSVLGGTIYGFASRSPVRSRVKRVTVGAMLVSIIVGGILMGGILAIDRPPSLSRPDPRKDFMWAVRNHHFETVASGLQKVGQHDTPAGLYVLAQVALAEDKPNAKGRPSIDARLAGRITSPAAGFTPKGEVLYAIEHAGYGEARSPAAVAYRDERLAQQGRARTGTIILGGLSVAVGAAALGALVLRHAIGRRVRRIRGLLEAESRNAGGTE